MKSLTKLVGLFLFQPFYITRKRVILLLERMFIKYSGLQAILLVNTVVKF